MPTMSPAGPTATPASPSGASPGSRILDSAPPMPSKQKRPQSPLFTPPMDENAGMGALGGDPLIQLMSASKNVDMEFQKIAAMNPMAVQPLAAIQMQFRQLVTELMASQSPDMGMGGGMGGGMGQGMAPGIIPPLPQEPGVNPGMQAGVGV